MPFIVGLTGGIGSGKTSATNFFIECGIDIIDTDEIAHELTCVGGIAIGSVRAVFGDQVVQQDGALDRAAMRKLVFSDAKARKKLESILHPLIYQQTVLRIAAVQSPYGILVVPLLLETTCFSELVDRIVVVDCSEQQQIERVMQRSQLDEAEVRAMMQAQLSRLERLARADDVLMNHSDKQNLREQVLALHDKYCHLARIVSI